ncbi:AIPR family protein [bacterium]|nr:AIPR family protein [bacterium]
MAVLDKFPSQLQQDILLQESLSNDSSEGEGSLSKREILADIVGDALVRIGAVTDFTRAYFEIHSESNEPSVFDGYWVESPENQNEPETVLHLLSISNYGALFTVNNLASKERIEIDSNAACRVVEAILAGGLSVEESDNSATEAVAAISDAASSLRKVVLHLFYVGVVPDRIVKEYSGTSDFRIGASGPVVDLDLWDLNRLELVSHAGQTNEALGIKFEDFGFSEPMPGLKIYEECDSYDAYLTSFPADLLADMYETHGSKLMELNVRSFLQAGGKVNKGMKETIHNSPERFFVYNNGLCLTAGKVIRDCDIAHGPVKISGLDGLQIVNGGQTVASLHRAKVVDKADLSGIWVQVKITEIVDNDADIVLNISKYSNAQNAVRATDFSSNDPFHVSLSEYSLGIFCPDNTTRWFYERSRGGYNVSRLASSNAEKQKAFKGQFPASKKFSKTDVAKWAHSSISLPHIIGLGGERNFLDFKERNNTDEINVNEEYYKELIAKGIIYGEAERIAKEQKIPAYRANAVAYTVSMLWYVYGVSIDLKKIWKHQVATADVTAVLSEWLIPIIEKIKETSDGRNITEWCKKESCWDTIRGWADIPAVDLSDLQEAREDDLVIPAGDYTRQHLINLNICSKISEDDFIEMLRWAKENIGEFGIQKIHVQVGGTALAMILSGEAKVLSLKQSNRIVQLWDAFSQRNA